MKRVKTEPVNQIEDQDPLIANWIAEDKEYWAAHRLDCSLCEIKERIEALLAIKDEETLWQIIQRIDRALTNIEKDFVS